MVISRLLFLPWAARLGSSLKPGTELHRGPELHCPSSIACHFHATRDDFAHHRTMDNWEPTYLNLMVPEKERAVPKWKSNTPLLSLYEWVSRKQLTSAALLPIFLHPWTLDTKAVSSWRLDGFNLSTLHALIITQRIMPLELSFEKHYIFIL